MKKGISIFFALCFIMIMTGITARPAYALAVSGVNFSVQAMIPDNQINKRNTYFDLKMQPGQTQRLSVAVFNNSHEEQTYHIALNAASTNQNGVVEYAVADVRDESLRWPLSAIATLDKSQLTLPSGQSGFVHIDIAMPEESYDGIILGGVVITKEDAQSEAAQSEGISIQNRYAYVIGVMLRETDAQVQPELHLQYIRPALVNYRTAVVANIQNDKPALIRGLKITAQVFSDNEETPMRQTVKDNVDMAPNSNFDFAIDWEDQRLAPGSYRLHMTAVWEDQRWEWDEPFTIENNAASIVNNESVNVPPSPVIWPYIVAGVVLAAVTLWLGVKLGKRSAHS